MKKTLLTTMLAGLFSLSTFAASDTTVVKVEVMGDHETPVSLNVENDGYVQLFSFDSDELKDIEGVTQSLSDLDEKTRSLVLKALKGVHLNHGLLTSIDEATILEDDDQVFVVPDGKHKYDQDGQWVIELEQLDEHHRLSEFVTGAHKVFKVKRGELHADPAEATKVIERLLKNNKLSAEQLDAIQSMLDEKR